MAKPKRPRRHNEAPRDADSKRPAFTRNYDEARTRRWLWEDEDFVVVSKGPEAKRKEEGEA